MVAVVWAFYRRYVEKLVRLKRGFKSGLVLLFIGGLMLSVLVGNGAEIIWHDLPYAWTAPIASGIAMALGFLGKTGAAVVFFISWWIHLLFLLTFLVYVPQSKHAHLIAGPLNVWLGRKDKVGKLSSINFEDETQEVFGVNKIEDFNQKQLVDLYACVECGRCTNVCPATGTGKMLSPMDMIVKLRDHLTVKVLLLHPAHLGCQHLRSPTQQATRSHLKLEAKVLKKQRQQQTDHLPLLMMWK